MKIDFKNGILIALLFFTIGKSVGQETEDSKEKDMYSAFHRFFEDEIRRQGVKLNWIFRLEEITGLHTFDMDNDGLKEVLFEFDAVPEEGGGVTNSYAVLFYETELNKFKLGNYIETPFTRFLSVDDRVFRFFNRKKNEVEKYTFENRKFNKI